MMAFIKMLEYKRIDISDGIDVDISDKSKECMLCHYWYFLDKSFSYGPTYLKKIKRKRENMEKIDIIICLKKRSRN